MKQLSQRMRDGELRVVDVPPPAIDEWKVLVRTHASLVSAGTERAKVEVARDSLLGKARRRPDDVRQVLDKLKTDGVRATLDAVRSRLEALSPLGYCAAGRVERVGRRVREVYPGDLVACGGEGAAHAELIAVPGNLCVRIPDGVATDAAAFTTLGSIALHGFRQSDAKLGERVAVVGLGLVGQLTARIARAAGCEVLGVDLEEWRLAIGTRANAIHVARTRGDIRGEDLGSCDSVLVTAAAPGTSDPVSLATDLARERGTIVVVGDVLLELDRRRLYAKELELRLARSYGPGRYDREYEERGLDYPIGYVRWTERRNMAAFLELLAAGRVTVDDLVTHRFPIAESDRALDLLTDQRERALGIVIEYELEGGRDEPAGQDLPRSRKVFAPGSGVAFVGAGSFARRHLIPLARRHGLVLERVVTGTGLSATSVAEQFGFRGGAGTLDDVLEDETVSGVVIATRHDEHGDIALRALRAGKAVFVEKPLCLTEHELEELSAELARSDAPPLMVGFNRRFAPLVRALQEHLAGANGPTNVLVRVNAGPLAPDHWLNDPASGGGRLLGEGCHFVDLLSELVGAAPETVSTSARQRADEPLQSVQDFCVSVRYDDGSLGTLLYGTTGAGGAGKELVEAHRGDRSGRLDDFRSVRLWGGGRPRTIRRSGQDKGHDAEMRAFAAVVKGDGPAPPVTSYLDATAVTLAALRSLENGADVTARLA